MKKLLATLLALCMIFALCACGQTAAPATDPTPAQADPTPAAEPAAEPVNITLWTYPIGGWGNADTVDALIAAFEAANPGITVTVEYLDYTNGDDQVNTALEGGSAPDLIMEGPERLVANWGAKGYMVDLADMWDATDKAEVNVACVSACFNADGACYEYPLVMTAHCMAINYDAFVAAGADQYVDTETHTWTTENFIKAVDALYAYYKEPVGDVYCSGQGGDQGTRALVNNLYGGMFTNAEHTAYTADSPENIKALELLQSMDGIYFNAAENGGEEITAFRQGILKMAFCWNIAQQLNSDNNDAGLTNDGDEIMPMAFPTESGDPKLCGGIWGFGVFDNGDEAKVKAAKTFIEFIAADPDQVKDSVLASTYFPVRASVGDIYADNAIMSEYTKFMAYLGDYYQITPGWATARTEWWNMLQRVGTGEDVATSVATFVQNANAAAEA